jgi:uncharacterized protein
MKEIILIGIKLYKMVLRPILPPACRFYPSCSDYAFESVSRFGMLKGSVLAAKRVMRCHPFHEGGFDPVPDIESQRGTER